MFSIGRWSFKTVWLYQLIASIMVKMLPFKKCSPHIIPPLMIFFDPEKLDPKPYFCISNPYVLQSSRLIIVRVKDFKFIKNSVTSKHARGNKYCTPRTLTYGQDYHDACEDCLLSQRISRICSICTTTPFLLLGLRLGLGSWGWNHLLVGYFGWRNGSGVACRVGGWVVHRLQLHYSPYQDYSAALNLTFLSIKKIFDSKNMSTLKKDYAKSEKNLTHPIFKNHYWITLLTPK